MLPNIPFGNRRSQELAKEIGDFFRSQNHDPDARPVTPPPELPPDTSSMKPNEAKKTLADHEESERQYLDYLLKRPGPLNAQEQAFIARGIRLWNQAGRPE